MEEWKGRSQESAGDSRQTADGSRKMGDGHDGCWAGCSWPFAHQTLCQTFVSNGQAGEKAAQEGAALGLGHFKLVDTSDS